MEFLACAAEHVKDVKDVLFSITLLFILSVFPSESKDFETWFKNRTISPDRVQHCSKQHFIV